MKKVISLEQEKAKRKDTFVSMFLRQHGKVGYNPYVANKLLGKHFGQEPDKDFKPTTYKSTSTLRMIDVLLWYMINNIEDWDKQTIIEELKDLRYEIQGMNNNQCLHKDIRRKQIIALIAAWALESNTNIIKSNGHMLTAPADIFQLWNKEYKEKINNFCKQHDYKYKNKKENK